MSLSNDDLANLERLDRLRTSGALTQEEFELAKQRVLSKQTPPEPIQGEMHLPPSDQQTRSTESAAGVINYGVPTSIKTPLPVGEQLAIVFALVMIVVCALVLFLPFKSERLDLTCSSPIIQLFDKDDTRTVGKYPFESTDWDNQYRFCKRTAQIRSGVGIGGLIATGAISAGIVSTSRSRTISRSSRTE